MKFTAKRTSEVTVPGIDGTVVVNHLTTKQYHTFRVTRDQSPDDAIRYLVQVSLGLDDAAYDDVPMSLMPDLVKAILKANGLSPEQEREELKN